MARTFSPSELLEYDGSAPGKPVYVAIKGTVYDVSASKEFYGKGGPYEAFAGRECSRALAIMKVDPAECNDDLADCSEKQLKTLEDWIAKFNAKYRVVGKLLHGDSDEGSQAELSLLRRSPFPPSLVFMLVFVGLLTLLGAYLLFLDLQGKTPLGGHSEL